MKITATIKQVKDMERGRRYRVVVDPLRKSCGATRRERAITIEGVFVDKNTGLAINGDARLQLHLGWTFGENIVATPSRHVGRKADGPEHPCQKVGRRYETHGVISIEELGAFELTEAAIDALETAGETARERGDAAAADNARAQLRLVAWLLEYDRDAVDELIDLAAAAAERLVTK